MKVTIELDEELFRLLERISNRSGTPLGTVIADLARRGLDSVDDLDFDQSEDAPDYTDDFDEPVDD